MEGLTQIFTMDTICHLGDDKLYQELKTAIHSVVLMVFPIYPETYLHEDAGREYYDTKERVDHGP